MNILNWFAWSILVSAVGALEPLTTGLGIGVAIVGSVGYSVRCHFKECCTSPWIRHNVSLFDEQFDLNVYGQPLVKDVVSKALRSHLRRIHNKSPTKPGPKKALVLSFHGWTGSGKNYVSRFIAESMFSEGLRSKFVHFFSGPLHFPQSQAPEIHQLHVQDMVRTNVSQCGQSLFIFDEVDKMHPKVLDGIKAFIDTHQAIDGVDFRQSVFVLLSNSGGSSINKRALSLWQEGVGRSKVKLSDFEDILQINAFNEVGGLQKSELIVSHLVDFFVPFLPLERAHVKQCALQDLKHLIPQSVNKTHTLVCEDKEVLAELVSTQLTFMPKDIGVFSETGCKRVQNKVGIVLETILEELEEGDSKNDHQESVALLGRCRFIIF